MTSLANWSSMLLLLRLLFGTFVIGSGVSAALISAHCAGHRRPHLMSMLIAQMSIVPLKSSKTI